MRIPLFALFAFLAIPRPSLASTLYATDSTSATLRIIDQTTAAQTVVGTIGAGLSPADLASDTRSGSFRLWTVDRSIFNAEKLYRIDPATGAGTLVGNFGVSPNPTALAFDPVAAKLYGTYSFLDAPGVQLFLVDTNTAALTSIGGRTSHALEGLGTDNSGQLFMLVSFGSLAPHDLYRIDPTTGAANFVLHTDLPTSSSPLVVSDIAIRAEDGLAFVILYSSSGNSLYTLDLGTGLSTPVGSLNINPSSHLTGLAFSPAVPEPPAISSIALAVALATARRKRTAPN